MCLCLCLTCAICYDRGRRFVVCRPVSSGGDETTSNAEGCSPGIGVVDTNDVDASFDAPPPVPPRGEMAARM